jgi:hypothetical protein
LAVSALSQFAGSGLAEDCSFLKRDPLDLRDRQVFFQIKGTPAWTSLDDSSVDLANLSVSFAYVIRETIDPARSGVVILKSGRTPRLDEPQVSRQSKQVLLVRHAEPFDNGTCGLVSEFGERPISAKSYDDYHDEGLSVPEMKAIRAFHFRYAARDDRCRRTDSSSPDSLVPPDLRSNRAQFSFNPDVVSQGTYSQVLSWAGVTKVYASSEGLADQRVEMKQYRVAANSPTCVRFSLPIQGRSSFLKINDLEALVPGTLRYFRSDEKKWNLSP